MNHNVIVAPGFAVIFKAPIKKIDICLPRAL